MRLGELMTFAKDLAQVGFWVVGGSVAILTYRQAKRTVLQPLKTEVFKRQIEDAGAVLSLFAGKGEVALRQTFDFRTIIGVNITWMYDAYARYAFGMKLSDEARAELEELCPTLIIPIDSFHARFERVVGHLGESSFASSANARNEEKASEWKYHGEPLGISKEFTANVDKLREVRDNPLLPEAIGRNLDRYVEVAEENLDIIRSVIARLAPEMPHRYPNLEAYYKNSFAWIEAAINDEFRHLEPSAAEVIRACRAYFDADFLSGKDNRRTELNRLRQGIARGVRRLRIAGGLWFWLLGKRKRRIVSSEASSDPLSSGGGGE
ncbi:hypothetical protein ACPXCJ_30115 [Micromonospora chalcea]|uniref:hypothetical protein n=1 Tax=Micromonospora chalcea TaxID=1874 RepID=UPI003CF32586